MDENSWKQLSDARLECRAKEFIRIELELALTFVKVARTKYSMGNVGYRCTRFSMLVGSRFVW